MVTEPEARPPEATLIQLARKAAGLSAEDAAAEVRKAGGKISATYWRDVERGHGGRRGQQVPTRASDTILAQMARTLGISADRLETEGQRPDAAAVLREMPAEAFAEVIQLPIAVARMATGRLAVIEQALGSPVNLDVDIEAKLADQPSKDPDLIAREIAAVRALQDRHARDRGASGGR